MTGLAPSSYYYKPDRSDRQRREAEDEKLRLQIDDIHAEFPRVTATVASCGNWTVVASRSTPNVFAA